MKTILFALFMSCSVSLLAQDGKENYFMTGVGVRLDFALISDERTYNVHAQYTRTLNRWLRYSVRTEFSNESQIRSFFDDLPAFNQSYRLDISGVYPSAAENLVEHDDPNPGIAQFERVYWSQNNLTTTFYMGFSPIYTRQFQLVLQAGPYLRYSKTLYRENSLPFQFEHEALLPFEGERVRTHWTYETRKLMASANLNVLFAYTLRERYVLAVDSTLRLYTAEDDKVFDGFGTDGVFGTFIFGIKF